MAENMALIIVDLQNDFCPGGALPVPDGDLIIAPLNRVAERFARHGLTVFASRDWHPAETEHFQEYGGPWPAHCVQGTDGAAFHPDLHLPNNAIILSKGIDRHTDGYSAFDGISCLGLSLAELLKSRGIRQLYVGGLATDYCVRATVMDAIKHGLAVTVLADGTAGVDIKAGDSQRSLEEMQQAGARILRVDEMLAPRAATRAETKSSVIDIPCPGEKG